MAWSRVTVMTMVLGLGGCASDRENPFADGDATEETDGVETSAANTSTSGASTTGGGPDGGPDGDPAGGGGTLDGDGSGGAEESGFGMDDDLPLATSIPTIKQGEVGIGTYVLLEKVVVTTPVAEVGPGVRDLYVQDREGGLWSGLRLTSEPPLELWPGDVVDVIGRVREVDGVRFIEGDADFLEEGRDPTPLDVDVNILEPGSVSFEVREGVLVRLTNLKITLDRDDTPLLDGRVRLDSTFADNLPPLGPSDAVWSVVGVLMSTSEGIAIGPRSAADLDL